MFFIVGCERSGTTLLNRMISAHPDMGVIPARVHRITKRYDARDGLTADGITRPDFPERFMDAPGLRGDAMDVAPDCLRVGVPYADVIADLFARWGALHGKRLVGGRTRPRERALRVLRELWPDARFVHLIRDGRDVCLSALAWDNAERRLGRYPTWPDDKVTAAAVWWAEHVRIGRGMQDACEVRYEDLVADPDRTCNALCSFLGVPYDDAMLRFHEGREREGADAKHAWKPVTAGLRSWRTQMPHEDVERFEAVAGELLDELGYGRHA